MEPVVAAEQAPLPVSNKLIYPVDPETGVPHLLRIYDCAPVSRHGATTNYDHSWFPRRAEDLSDLGGRALRMSMGQQIPLAIHDRKNKLFSSLSYLPSTDDEKFVAIVNGLSGMVPRTVVDLGHGQDVESMLVQIGDEEFAYLTNRRRFYRESCFKDRPSQHRRNEIGRFFVRYALGTGLQEAIPDSLIDQFLTLSEYRTYHGNESETVALRCKELGNLIIKKAVERAARSVEPIQCELSARGVAAQPMAKPVSVIRKFIDNQKLPDYHPYLIKQLAHAA